MPLDPSIYNNVGRVNLGQGLSDILNQQREREAAAEQRQMTLASLAQQQQAAQAQQAEAQRKAQSQRGKELNMWLSGAVQSGRPIEQVLPEAIAKGQEIGVSPEITQRHVTSVYGAGKDVQSRSNFALGQAFPEEFAKARIASQFRQQPQDQIVKAKNGIYRVTSGGDVIPLGLETEPSKPEPLEAVIGPNGKPILLPTSQASGMQPYKGVAPSDDIARQRLELERQKFEFEKTKPQKAAQLSPTAQKELFQAEDTIQASRNVVGILDEALKINDKAYSGAYATERAIARSNLPGKDDAADATINLNNMMTGQALETLRATFGGSPTEGERQILLDMQAAPNKTPEQRRMIIERAKKAAQNRIKFNEDRARKLRSGEFFTEQPAESAPAQGGAKFLGFE